MQRYKNIFVNANLFEDFFAYLRKIVYLCKVIFEKQQKT